MLSTNNQVWFVDVNDIHVCKMFLVAIFERRYSVLHYYNFQCQQVVYFVNSMNR